MSASKTDGNVFVKEPHLERTSGNPDDDLVILMIGKTGHGKSSTGNTILGREVFESADMSESVTDNIQCAWAKRNNRVVKVVDGPGLCDTRKQKREDVEHFITQMELGFAECLEGFNAIAIVLRYGQKFTDEEQKTIDILNKIFGEDFILKHGVVIFTHGNDFEENNKESGKTFKQWCTEQKGALKDILTKCQERYILLENSSRVLKEQKDKKVKTLLDLVSKIPKRYTNETFKKKRREREKLIKDLKAEELKEEVLRTLDLLLSSLLGSHFDEIKGHANDLKEEIRKTDVDTRMLRDLKKLAKRVIKKVDEQQYEFEEELSILKDLRYQLHRRRKTELIRRIALGIFTLGVSELFRLVWK